MMQFASTQVFVRFHCRYKVEDREQSPTESICEPPAHLPEVFLRRQSLPFGLKPPEEDGKSDEKRTRFASRAMSFQH
uniref:Uncharacterized protein n=1 Tax=Caenorhabditis japonica TaxID=281687 RepID=A0A8R1DVM8_CAEJA